MLAQMTVYKVFENYDYIMAILPDQPAITIAQSGVVKMKLERGDVGSLC